MTPDTRVGMLRVGGSHYEPVFFEGKGCFSVHDLPPVVETSWGQKLRDSITREAARHPSSDA